MALIKLEPGSIRDWSDFIRAMGFIIEDALDGFATIHCSGSGEYSFYTDGDCPADFEAFTIKVFNKESWQTEEMKAYQDPEASSRRLTTPSDN
jgi:hypothetical protein